MHPLVSVRLLCLGVTLVGTPVVATAQGALPHLTPQEWREDLQFMVTAMRQRHKSLFHFMPESSFTRAVESLDNDIPHLDDDHILVRLAQIGAMIQDGHSGVPLRDAERDVLNRIPVRFIQYSDGIYVRAASPAYADAVGGKVVAIGKYGWEDAIHRVNTVVSHDPDNIGLQRAWAAPLYLNWPALLYGLDISPSRDTADVVIEKKGVRRTFRMTPSVAMGPWYLNTLPPGWLDARPTSVATPLAVQHPDHWYWLTYRPEAHAIYVQFNGVANADSESLTAFSQRLAAAMVRPDVRRVVLDVRYNSGGDNQLLRPLLIALIRSKSNVRGGMYCLIGPATFSAAQNFVDRLEKYTETIFVGQPTGANVNSYGDPTPIELPHSHLRAEVSTLWWQDMDPTDTRSALFPEIAILPAFADYVAGNDPALQIALFGTVPPTLEQVVTSALRGGPDSAQARYTAYLNDPQRRYVAHDHDERHLYDLGYSLLQAKRARDAITLFTMNARLYPRSAYEYDGLGDAYLAAGDSAGALSAFRQALDVHTGDSKATSMVNRLAGTR